MFRQKIFRTDPAYPIISSSRNRQPVRRVANPLISGAHPNMKIAVVIARVLLGLIFLIFGLNNFFHFIPGQIPPGDAEVFSTIMFKHGWVAFHGVLYLIAAALLLIGRYVPVGLTILGPFLVNILLFHLTLLPGIAPGLFATVLELFLIWAYWPAFRGIFTAKMEPLSFT
jgi:hypothetical protein